VAGAGHGTRLQDRRYSFSSGPTQWARNSKRCPLAPSLLAYLLFASFALFAPSNVITKATLTLCALAIAGSIGMILELERGFGGLVQVSPQAMNHAVAALQAEANNENSGSHT
jgi:hypothetical protein